MLKFLLLLLLLFALAFGFHALSNQSGEVALTVGDTAYAVNLTTAVIGLIALVLVAMGLIWFIRGLLRAPWLIARHWRRRNRERGREAVAQGLIAIAAGDTRAAERAVLEASRRAPGQPLTRLLQAQTAQLKGDRIVAREIFKDMVEDPATRIAGLRGLYTEAERENESEAAHQIAARARAEAPAVGWAARALLRHQTAADDWDAALATLSGAADARILDKRTARRQRAVILTAKALAREDGEPDIARAAAQEAHDLAADLVPAAVVAGRLFARQGDIRRATRILEAAWKTNPHPEIADAYTHVRPGDSALDRLKRAETLFRLRSLADEGRHAVARAAIDARDFSRAREVLAPVLTERPTQRALMLMASLEEAETGDRGRAREWQARAVYAPRDPVWTADGKVLEEWAPVSPISGRIDAVEWKVPLAEIEGPRIEIATTDVMTAPVVSRAPDSPSPPVATAPLAISTAAAIPPQPAGPPPAGVPVSLPSWLAAPAESQPFAVPSAPSQPPPRHSPAPVALVPRSEKARPVPPPPAEPPRPDDPGVIDESDAPDERRSGAL